VARHQFRKRKLHLMVADKPASKLGGRGVTSGLQCVLQRFGAQHAQSKRLSECGIARTPRTQEAKADERSGHGAIVRRQRRGQGKQGIEHDTVGGHLERGMFANSGSATVVRATHDNACEERWGEPSGLLSECQRQWRGKITRGVMQRRRRHKQQISPNHTLGNGPISPSGGCSHMVCFIDDHQPGATCAGRHALGPGATSRVTLDRLQFHVSQLRARDGMSPHGQQCGGRDDADLCISSRHSERHERFAQANVIGEQRHMKIMQGMVNAVNGVLLVRQERDVAE